MGLVNESTRDRNIPIGKIDIMKSFSFFEIDKQYTDKVLEGLNGYGFEGVKVNSEIAKERPSGGGNDRGGNRDKKRQSSGARNEGGSYDRSKKRSGSKSGSGKRSRRRR